VVLVSSWKKLRTHLSDVSSLNAWPNGFEGLRGGAAAWAEVEIERAIEHGVSPMAPNEYPSTRGTLARRFW
jgi:hypothetical protein